MQKDMNNVEMFIRISDFANVCNSSTTFIKYSEDIL